jgi:hypothetical protein
MFARAAAFAASTSMPFAATYPGWPNEVPDLEYKGASIPTAYEYLGVEPSLDSTHEDFHESWSYVVSPVCAI